MNKNVGYIEDRNLIEVQSNEIVTEITELSYGLSCIKIGMDFARMQTGTRKQLMSKAQKAIQPLVALASLLFVPSSLGAQLVTEEAIRVQVLKSAFPQATVSASHSKPRPNSWPGDELTDALAGEREYEVIGVPDKFEESWRLVMLQKILTRSRTTNDVFGFESTRSRRTALFPGSTLPWLITNLWVYGLTRAVASGSRGFLCCRTKVVRGLSTRPMTR